MKLSRILCPIALALATGLTVQAQTVTVNSSGGADFTNIQAAINSINPTNGQPDIIEVQDGATYTEQIVLGGLPPIDQAAIGSFITDLVNENRDPLIVRGIGAKPVIWPDSGNLAAYGVFENDAGDNFTAGIAFFGDDITLENVEIRQPDGNSSYGLNGQANKITFKEVLFKPTTSDQAEDFFNVNNSDGVVTLFGNGGTYSFEDCVFDGENEDGVKANAKIYFHGISDLATPMTSVFNFDGCEFKNTNDELTRLRARPASQGSIDINMTNCRFVDNDAKALYLQGNGVNTIDGCWFENNTNGADVNQTSDASTIFVHERDGHSPSLIVKNTVFANNASNNATNNTVDGRYAVILVQNGNDVSGDITIDHCTFDGNGAAVRFFDPNLRDRKATITNTIFSNNITAGITGDGNDGTNLSYVPDSVEFLDITITNSLFFSNGVNFDVGTDSGTVSGDPMFADATFKLSDGSPASGAATDGTDIGAVQGGTAVEGFMLY
ncbi:MAG: hypothetical protein P9L94_11040 [Candidatus Hinthialibacter antarcticus]|nr:hypothetical protein [Candidatus Hinthialibacter antarcticus]